MSTESIEEWYDSHLELHRRLTRLAKITVEQIIEQSEIPHLTLQSRVKARDRFLQKALDGDYADPTQDIHDICGVRLITYVRSDRDKLAEVLSSASFEVIKVRNHDKPDGYRARHLVCEFGDDRCRLPEFAPFAGRPFEIQLHTVLDHAWATITHDRQYKFAGGLPLHLDARFNILSAALRESDAEFDRLAMEIDAYTSTLNKKHASGELDSPIDAMSLERFLKIHLDGGGRRPPRMNERRIVDRLIRELKAFRIYALADLKDLLSQDVLDRAYNGTTRRFSTVAGLLRTAMLLTDIERYFQDAWQHHWKRCWGPMYRVIQDKWGSERVNRLLAQHGVIASVAAPADPRDR